MSKEHSSLFAASLFGCRWAGLGRRDVKVARSEGGANSKWLVRRMLETSKHGLSSHFAGILGFE